MPRYRPLAALLALAIPAVAAAHHGWSEYDPAKPMQVAARLTDIQWNNPHGTARMKYRGKNWAVVLAPIARMNARGLSPTLVGNKRVILFGQPRKDGTPEIKVERLIAGGKTYELR
jgi:hypothetical protein